MPLAVSPIHRFLIQPLLWWVREVEAVPSYEQTAWQRGRAAAVAAAKDGRSFGFVSTVLTCALPTAAGFATTHLSTVPQIVLIVLAGVVGYLLVPMMWASAVALRAPVLQRNEARQEAAQVRAEDHTVAVKIRLLEPCRSARDLLERGPDRASDEFHKGFAGVVRDTCHILRTGGYDDAADLFDSDGRFEHNPGYEYEPVRLRVIILRTWTDPRWLRFSPCEEPEFDPREPDHAKIIAGLRAELEFRLSERTA